MSPALRPAVRSLLRAVARQRWLLAAGLVAAAVATALPIVAPPPPTTTPVLAAARDIGPGATLSADDVRRVAVPPDLVPAGALPPDSDVTGRRLAGPVRRGEPLTDVRLVGPGLLALVPDPDAVAVPVRLADGAAAALLRTGDRVDVLGAAETADGAAPRPAAVLAAAATVLAVPPPDDVGDGDGALVVVAAAPATAARLAAGAVGSSLSVVLHR